MDVRTWLTNKQSVVIEGNLSEICIRLFAAWGMLSVLPFMGAVAIWVALPAEFVWFAVGLLGVIVLLYVYLVIQAIRVFRPAENKDMSSWLFVLLQVAMFVMFGLAFWNDRRHLPDMWGMLGFAFSAIMAFLDLTFIIIGLAARQRVGVTVWAGFAAALTSCGLFIKADLLG